MVKTILKIPSKRCCKSCEITKDINEFPTNRNKEKLSYRHRCITCERIHVKDINKANYEKRKKVIIKEDKTDTEIEDVSPQ